MSAFNPNDGSNRPQDGRDSDIDNDKDSDQAARRAAVDPAHSVIVQAPAGSGKTTLLVERYLGLLSRVSEPEKILAITFTRKAAAEMKQRVLRYLDPAFETDLPHEKHALNKARAAEPKVREWNLRENPQRMQIRTIDSFNQYLAKRMPVASQLGPLPTPSDNAQRLYRQAARSVLTEIEKGSQRNRLLAEDVQRLLAWRDHNLREMEDLLAELLAKREQWLRVLGPAGAPDREYLQALMTGLIEQHLLQAAQSLTEALESARSGTHELAALARSAAGTLMAEGKSGRILDCIELDALPGPSVRDLNRWRGLVELLLMKNQAAFRKTVDIRQGFVAKSAEKERMLTLLASLSSNEALSRMLTLVRQLPQPSYADNDWQTLESLIRVMQQAAIELQLVFAERGQSDFAALGEAALRGLGDDRETVTDLGLYLDYRIQHLLVDEFQDTNYSQFRLLEKLTRGWQPGDGRSLFLVGDPMQSIYRFREAEVGLFMRVRDFGLNALKLTPLRLSANYRSQTQIVDWVNTAIGPIFPEQEEIASGSVAYAPSSSKQGDRGEIEILTLPDRATEAQVLAELLRQERHRAGRTAIIVRSRSHLAEILPALRRAGVRYRAVKLDPLIARPVVQDLLALTRAIHNPADRSAALALLRAPFAGLTLDDLDRLAGLQAGQEPVQTGLKPSAMANAHPFNPDALQRLSDDGRARATRVFDALQQAQRLWRQRSLRDLVEGAWHALHGPACLEQPELDVQDAADYLDFVELAEREDWLEDAQVFEERLQVEQSGHQLDQNESDDSAALEVLTMHSAKGLEWDWVILPGLDRAPRSRTGELLNWLPFTDQAGHERVLLAPLRAATQAQNPEIVEFIRGEQAARDRFENQRLLYVAATRARQKLTLSACLDADKETPKPPASSLLGELWPQLEQTFLAELNAARHPTPPAASMPDQSLKRVAGDWIGAVGSGLTWQPRLPLREHETEIEFNWAGMQARRVGSVIHRLLERVGQIGIEQLDNAQRVRLMRRIPHLLLALGTADTELEETVTIVQSAFENTLSDPTGQWILSGKHRDSACELALTGEIEGALINAVIDRTFIDEQGCRWIIDYKSGFHDGADLDGFLAAETRLYRDQLRRYAQLFRQMEERPITTALYFPRHQRLLPIDL